HRAAVVGPLHLLKARRVLARHLGDLEGVFVRPAGGGGLDVRIDGLEVRAGIAAECGEHLGRGDRVRRPRAGGAVAGLGGAAVGAAAHVDGEDHALLAVAGDRTPAVQVAADHAHVQGRALAGGEPAGVLAGFEHQVVHLIVGVGDVQDHLVARIDLDAVGGEAHVLGLDVDLDGPAGGGDPAGGVTGGGRAADA